MDALKIELLILSTSSSGVKTEPAQMEIIQIT